MKFEILSDPKNLKIVRQNVRDAINEYKFNVKNLDAVILAIDEAVQNIIRYAYEMDKSKKITFDIKKIKENLIIEIRDFGKQVDLSVIKSRDLDDVKPGGLGVHFIKSICKSVDYKHIMDEFGGTELTLVF